jgi:hypothetical protein
MWTRLCREENKRVAAARPGDPNLQNMRLLSYIERLLPEIRGLSATIDGDSGTEK